MFTSTREFYTHILEYIIWILTFASCTLHWCCCLINGQVWPLTWLRPWKSTNIQLICRQYYLDSRRCTRTESLCTLWVWTIYPANTLQWFLKEFFFRRFPLIPATTPHACHNLRVTLQTNYVSNASYGMAGDEGVGGGGGWRAVAAGGSITWMTNWNNRKRKQITVSAVASKQGKGDAGTLCEASLAPPSPHPPPNLPLAAVPSPSGETR